jgi:hypothetical protein
MAEQKILISIRINDREAANTQKQLKVTKDNFNSLTDAEKAKIVADKQLALSAKEVDKALTLQAQAANSAEDATGKMGATSGLNNAILMETSRLASDASFGFTAIANNVSQLVNLLQSQVQATGSLSTTFRRLISLQSLALIGVQLLITYGDTLYKSFVRLIDKTSEFNDTFSKLGEGVSSTAGNFEIYIRTIQDSNKSQEEHNIAIKKLKKEFPDYIEQLKDAEVSLEDVANNTETAAKENNKYRESLLELAMAIAAQNKIQELASDRLNLIEQRRSKLRSLGVNDEKEAQKKINEINQEYGDDLLAYNEEFNEINSIQDKDARIALLKSLENSEIASIYTRRQTLMAYKELNKEEIAEIDKQIDVYNKYTKLRNDNEEDGANDRNRIFKSADLDFEKQILSSQQRIEKLEVRHEKDLIAIKINAMGEKAVLKQSEFEQDQSRRLRDFLQSEATLEQKKLAEERYNNSVAESKESLYRYLIQLDNEYNATISDLEERRELEDLSAFGKALQAFNTERLNFQEQFLKSYTDSEIDRVEVAKQLENERFNNEMLNLKAIRDQRIADGETTYEIDQRIANATKANTEANISLAEQEGNAKIAIANKVGEAIVTVAGEGSAIGKAASIAMAIINTREAFTAALGAKPYSFLNIAQAAATLALGFSQVKKIMAVKIPSKKSSTSAAAGVDTTIQAPDFNVVGASQTSQLAEAVSTQQAKPVKAFVVGKDISTQQELDRNITNTASFG